MKRLLWLGLVVAVYVICSGCGETYRAVIIPTPPTFPNPAAAHSVVAIGDNGTFSYGSAMVIDVSGDSDVSVSNVGIHPVHAAQQSANEVLVLNQAVTEAETGEDSGTTSCLVPFPAPPKPLQYYYDVCPSLTMLNFSSTTINSTSTISLPIYSSPNFVAIAPSDTLAYVTLPTYPPDPTQPQDIVPSVGVVSIASNAMIETIPLTPHTDPVALAVTPDKSKLYVANKGDDTISAFNTADRSSRLIAGALTSAPIWLVPRTDSQRVYVLEQGSGILASINTTSTAGPDILTESAISVPGATTMAYDPNRNRLYIPGGQQMAIVDVAQPTPQPLVTLPIAPVSNLLRAQNDVCSTFSPSAVTTAAVAVLPDGSRAYVGSYAEFTVNVSILAATVNGANTTYTYSLTSGPPDLLPGMVITISNVDSTDINPNNNPPSDFDGTFTILSVGGGTFEVANSPTDTYVTGGTGDAPNICPQVTVINATSNMIETPSIAIPGVPAYDAFCANTRFRFMMAAGGDSSRAYLSSCDGGNVSIVDTSNDTYIENLSTPVSASAPIPPSTYNPPQNPVFLFAGP